MSDVSALPLNNCTARYQAALGEALTIKEQCEGAAFYDCCQVRSIKGHTCRLHSGEQISSIDKLGTCTASGYTFIFQLLLHVHILICSKNWRKGPGIVRSCT